MCCSGCASQCDLLLQVSPDLASLEHKALSSCGDRRLGFNSQISLHGAESVSLRSFFENTTGFNTIQQEEEQEMRLRLSLHLGVSVMVCGPTGLHWH